jgi:uncharacterized GH25 family protein
VNEVPLISEPKREDGKASGLDEPAPPLETVMARIEDRTARDEGRRTPGRVIPDRGWTMTRRDGMTLLAAALIAWTFPALADEKAVNDEAATGAITGRVVDREGRPIAGAEVWGMARGAAGREKVGTARTDADGRFRLAPLKEDRTVTVWADAPGVARERRDEVHVFAGRDHDIGPLALLPGTRMTGRAVDAQGHPIAGARVSVKDHRYILGHTITVDQAEWSFAADAEGRFATPPLPAGRPEIMVAAPGKVRTFLNRKAEPGTAEADLGDVTLADEVPLRGVVVDQDGAPAPGVEVIVDYDYDNAAKTDREGRFTVAGVGRDPKYLMLRSNDYFAPRRIDLGPDRDPLKLTVTKAYDIHGTAVDAETGKPVPIGTVQLCIVVREPDGSYSLRG